MSEPLRVVSYGGGVQSTALLVLAAKGYIDYQTFLFCNVGDDSEHPSTLRYVREVAFDYGAAHGIEVHELERRPQRGQYKGQTLTLWRQLMEEGSRSLPIPVRMMNGAPGRRSCTADFKIKVVAKWVKERGATEANPASIGIGISTDEYTRANNRRAEPYELTDYPLLNLEWNGRTGLSRSDCEQVIRDAGLPVPRKSACFFCPFHRPDTWRDQARDEPELFAKSVELEDTLNRRRDMLGKDHVYLTRFGKPLSEVIQAAQTQLIPDLAWDEDEGYRCGDVCDT